MPVQVSYGNSESTTFDNGESWSINADGSLSVVKDTGTVVAVFANESWMWAKKTPRDDKSQQFEEALDLVGLVDKGNFSNQDEDWRERAQTLLDATA